MGVIVLGIAYGAMGYLPTALSNPFQGGVTAMTGRSPLLIGMVYGAYGLLIFSVRRRLQMLLSVLAIAALSSLLLVTNSETILISLASHLTVWILFSIFLYCALGHYSCRNQGERALEDGKAIDISTLCLKNGGAFTK